MPLNEDNLEFEISQPDYKAAFGQLAFMVGIMNTAIAKGNSHLVEEVVKNAIEMIENVYNGPKLVSLDEISE